MFPAQILTAVNWRERTSAHVQVAAANKFDRVTRIHEGVQRTGTGCEVTVTSNAVVDTTSIPAQCSVRTQPFWLGEQQQQQPWQSGKFFRTVEMP